eukprot:5708961-Lingulodinium_polyedra.AAC.1
MRELAHAAVSVQESAVAEFSRFLRGNVAGPLPPLPEVPPLPLGPKERGQFCADGERETATAERLGLDASMDDQEF